MNTAIPKMSKTLLAVALTAAIGATSTNAMAEFLDFQVTEAAVPGSGVNTFVADKITGNYSELISFDGAGGFNVSLLWNAGQFVGNDGNTPVPSQLNSFGSAGYGLYALYTASGTFITVGGVTTFTTTAGTGALNVYLDPDSNTTFAQPGLATDAWTRTGTFGDDYRIAYGTPSSGAGMINSNLPTCGSDNGINCGSFGTTSSFFLEDPAGFNYFTAPNPFYNVTFQSGQLNNIPTVGTVLTNGSLDVVFNSVPEPTSVALLGIGLLGLGMGRRRHKQA